MTEATDLDAARIEFMDCAVEGAAGTGGKDEELEAREALQTKSRFCSVFTRVYLLQFFGLF